MRLFDLEEAGKAEYRTRGAKRNGGHPKPRPEGRNVWLTPPGIIEALGPFDLDPCAAPEPRPWPTAKRHICLPEDGLTADWGDFRTLVFLNPPYGGHTGAWIERLADHGSGIALVFARTECGWFQEHVFGRARAIHFMRGRVSYCTPDGTKDDGGGSPAPSVLVAYGGFAARRLEESGLPGKYVTLGLR